MTHRIPANHILIVGHRRQPDDGDDGVEDEGDEEVLVQGDSLATQTPASKLKKNVRNEDLSLDSGRRGEERRGAGPHLKWKNIPSEMSRDVSDRPWPIRDR